MNGGDNLYSQWVGWAKILLPVGGLALLSTLFLFARAPNDGTNIPVAQVIELAREQQLSAPEFSGLTDTGAVVVVSARSARPLPDQPDTATVDNLRMQMDNPGGGTLNVTGVTGEIDGRARIARFSGLVRLETSTGYTMETSGLTVTLDTGTAVSDGSLEIRAPMGNLTAGQVTFQVDTSNTGHQMLFTDGVRLIYTPQG
ncbi:LPS export ABC transporter periplasmic protein LptC [Yoonia vestfoldensis]|jgi:lipopolysaccharide export system protein LptC|uniref:LptC_YrbK: LPS export ABC transporter periplasmic protein LptC n=1 Tax=Yoonia vestfoldensis TaxID=245188 RepID=A0A1Y0EGK8_9RHOB|nr:LPS export ABC transporter periplasmic protein LptC [Yoonia vestfoldensis]ARU02766.1 LptC_YrbK: LPS export ABC transporter periplasmic protein LptC [Yoonia vestfoldensis]